MLVLDNAPYHHVHPEHSFFASQKNKTEIADKLRALRVPSIKVSPYVDDDPQCDPPDPTPMTPWSDYEQWVIVESTTGKSFLIDGMSDQGFGDAVVYVRVTKKKLGAVESTLVADFRRLLIDDFQLIGRGPSAIRYVRTVMNDRAKVPVGLRTRGEHLRTQCRRYARRCVGEEFEYRRGLHI